MGSAMGYTFLYIVILKAAILPSSFLVEVPNSEDSSGLHVFTPILFFLPNSSRTLPRVFQTTALWFQRDEAAERGELRQHAMGCRKGKSVCMSLRRKGLGNESCRCCVILSLCEMELVCGCEKGVFGSEQAWA